MDFDLGLRLGSCELSQSTLPQVSASHRSPTPDHASLFVVRGRGGAGVEMGGAGWGRADDVATEVKQTAQTCFSSIDLQHPNFGN